MRKADKQLMLSASTQAEKAKKALVDLLEKRRTLRPAIQLVPLIESINALVADKTAVGEIFQVIKSAGFEFNESAFRDALADLNIIKRQVKTRKTKALLGQGVSK